MELFLTFVASFIFIFLRAFQQRNVAFDHYRWVLPTSLAMAATEVVVIANIAMSGWHLPLVAVIGIGGGLGCLLSMVVHKKIMRPDK